LRGGRSPARTASWLFRIRPSGISPAGSAFRGKIEVVYNALDERFLREPMPTDADRVLERHAVTDPSCSMREISSRRKSARLIEAFAVAKADLRITRSTRD